jgi:hypothetical protein
MLCRLLCCPGAAHQYGAASPRSLAPGAWCGSDVCHGIGVAALPDRARRKAGSQGIQDTLARYEMCAQLIATARA